MCECCLAKCDDYGEIFPGWYLVRATCDSGYRMSKNDWGLVQCNSPAFIFEATPVKDPTVGLTDEEMDVPELDEPHQTFIDTAESIGADMFDGVEITTPSTPFHAYGELYQACVKAGYNKSSTVLYWMCHYIATYLEGDPNVRKWSDDYPDDQG